jgi:hypothetical protein
LGLWLSKGSWFDSSSPELFYLINILQILIKNSIKAD